ncbi:sulfite exporter TauE/SafE family protein [Bacillus circulans]|uniref:cytochrome c biogenesis CcdA family protein n=1 Tax=Niallia circulans TaxID=1397 RepID=UPI0015603D78|nr:cytochrome c biogenesis protein CcdA [Niallia circulans]NRG30038.1 sulfite exporter TauE/SafE family protein [Niallia circulans]
MVDINFFIALGAGFLSFISPCCLPLYPAYLSYITGMSSGQLKEEKLLNNASLIHTILFLFGFSIIFIALGFGSSLIGEYFKVYQEEIRKIGSLIIIFFGLTIIGLIKPQWLMKEYRFSFKTRPTGYLGSILIGLSFAAGWTPCNGPILAAVLSLASLHPETSLLYLGAYIIGFALPFIFLSSFISHWNKLKKYSVQWTKFGGFFMIVMGILLYVDGMKWLTRVISPIFGDFQGF